MDKISWIQSQFETKHGAGAVEMRREWTCPIIWEQFELVGSEKVDRVFGGINTTICLLDPYPTWLVKASRTVACKWVQALINALL